MAQEIDEGLSRRQEDLLDEPNDEPIPLRRETRNTQTHEPSVRKLGARCGAFTTFVTPRCYTRAHGW